jgi:acyl-CoA synthetase (NDP forming)
MITGGTEVIVGVADDHMSGPLIVFGLGGVDSGSGQNAAHT